MKRCHLRAYNRLVKECEISKKQIAEGKYKDFTASELWELINSPKKMRLIKKIKQ